MKKLVLLFFPLLLMIFSCEKESELAPLTSNNMEQSSGIDVFVLDSIVTNPFPWAKIYYHLNYGPIPDPSKIHKLVIYRNGVQVFTLLPAAANAFSPLDAGVARFNYYTYHFALMEADGTVSKLSAPHNVYIP
jgi:hypothetical protein